MKFKRIKNRNELLKHPVHLEEDLLFFSFFGGGGGGRCGSYYQMYCLQVVGPTTVGDL